MLSIFLDVDGVLHTKRSAKHWVKIALPYGAYTYRNLTWDNAAITQFLAFLYQLPTDFKIVLSSDWRWNNPEDSTRALFDQYKIPQYISTTPVLDYTGHGFRGREILNWLSENEKPYTPYLVIDDEHWGIDKVIPKQHSVFVQGGWQSGFNAWHRKHALHKVHKQLVGYGNSIVKV